MPRGRPKTGKAKQVVAVRLDPEMAEELRRLSPDNISGAIVAAITEWLKRARRKAAKAGDPLARHLAPPTAPREIATRRKDDAS
jgi:hypothetical protein